MSVVNSGPNIDIAGIYNCVIRFIIAISDQTINYAISRNLEELYKSLVFFCFFCVFYFTITYNTYITRNITYTSIPINYYYQYTNYTSYYT